jgi:hypothetical protein
MPEKDKKEIEEKLKQMRNVQNTNLGASQDAS